MNTDNTQDGAEPSPASAGSQPVAWANEDDDGTYEVGLSEAHAHYVLERAANGKYSHRNPRIVPLYRSPTLTDAEARALQFMLRHAAWACDQEAFHDSGDYRKHHDEVFRLMGRK